MSILEIVYKMLKKSKDNSRSTKMESTKQFPEMEEVQEVQGRVQLIIKSR